MTKYLFDSGILSVERRASTTMNAPAEQLVSLHMAAIKSG
jgi:hypothetical protein